MTVREVIEHLQTLDQDRGIWVCYDGFCYFPPLPDDMADGLIEDGEHHPGDYIITSG